MDDEVFLTVDDVAKKLQVHRQTVIKWILQEELTGHNVGSSLQPDYRIRPSNFEDFLKIREVRKVVKKKNTDSEEKKK